ncbi:hypothetical protein HHI36_011220 [Cryptolaemus montrouzieri]|uniref:Uncharacterized protein n=1 Tax=Cryptolaemus montrouzieri TaxID=559131 RepID=A0ABD2ML64_9CUCU
MEKELNNVSCLLVEYEMVSDQNTIVNELNFYFANVGKNIVRDVNSKIEVLPKESRNRLEFEEIYLENTILVQLIGTNDIKEVIKQLKEKFCCGPRHDNSKGYS